MNYNDILDIVSDYTQRVDDRQELAPKVILALKPEGYFSPLLTKTLGRDQLYYPAHIVLDLRFEEVDAS